MRALLTLLAIISLMANTAHANIGWTYEQCVAHWGKPIDHIFLQQETDHDLVITHLYIFRHRHGKHPYIGVQLHDWYLSQETHDRRVIREWASDNPGF